MMRRLLFLTLLLAGLGQWAHARTYSTTFSATENPISESGNWKNGSADGGGVWANCRTTGGTPGFVYGTQTGSDTYADSTCVLTGTWATNQFAQARVSMPNVSGTPPYEEVELRLRTTITATPSPSITGYEVLFQAATATNAYVQIVRWNGGLGNFTVLADVNGGVGLHTGDVVTATMVGSKITAYVNGQYITSATDSTYSSGAPGMGFYLQSAGAGGEVSGYGFTSFYASDEVPWLGVLNPTRAVEWKRANVGVPGGIPTSYTQCVTAACQTVTTNGPASTLAQINAAIASAPANTYVLLPAGTYNLAGGIDIRGHSNVILRGSGPTQTILHFTADGTGGSFGGSIYIGTTTQTASDSPSVQPGGSNSCTWSSGFAQGTTTITLTGCGSTGILNGDSIILDQKGDTTDTNGFVQCETSSPWLCMAQNQVEGRVISGIPWPQEQMVKVTAGCSSSCNGAGPYTLTISPRLYATNWGQGNGAGNTGAWFAKPVQNVGIENLTVDDTSCPNDIGCNSGIVFFNVYGGWVKNIRSLNTRRNHVHLINSSRAEVRDSYFFGVKNAASQSYGIETFPAFDSLIENNIFQQISSPFMPGGGAGNVWAYNFSRNNPVGVGYTYQQTSYASHSAGNYMTLFEGNYVNGIYADQLHGTSGLVTMFRNWLTGRDYNIYMTGDGLTTNQTYPFDLNSFNRGYNLIGNVVGTPGYHNLYEVYTGNSYTRDQCNHAIYVLGFSGGICDSDGTGGVADDALVRSTLMRWGNYDTVNEAVRWNTTEAQPGAVTYISANTLANSSDHTLPASFYLASKPDFFGSVSYPPIGPDVTSGTGPGGYAYRIPAANCYFTTLSGPPDGSGSALSFNAEVCYSSTPVPAASISPSSLAFTGQILNTTSAAQQVTLSNVGTATMTVASISTGTSDFAVASTNPAGGNCGGSIAAGGSCTLNVTFTPTQTGTRNGTLTISDNAAGSPHTVSLTGTGAAAGGGSIITRGPTSVRGAGSIR